MIGPTKLCPKGIGLVLVDLDGTILIDGIKITNRVLDTLSLARERGCMVCVSTGRGLFMVPEQLRLPEAMDYLICANGAHVYDTIAGTLREQTMTREQVLEMMDALRALRPGWNGFIGDRAYFEWRSFSYMATGRMEPLTPERARKALHTGFGTRARGMSRKTKWGLRTMKRILTHRENNFQVFRLRPYVEAAEDGIYKIGCSLASREACERAIAILEHMGDFEVARMGSRELEITAKGVTKGTSAQWLMDHLNVSQECTVAFGDSENDSPLIEVCGTFVAMGNADDRVKSRAADVCESNYDDGVARWLERAMAEADGAQYA